MDIKIHSLRFDADGKLLDFIENKVAKLDQFHDNIIGAEVTLRLEKSESSENKVADIKVQVPGSDLFSKKNLINGKLIFGQFFYKYIFPQITRIIRVKGGNIKFPTCPLMKFMYLVG